MNFLYRYFKKTITTHILAFIIAFALFGGAFIAFAVGPFAPGSTLMPSCAPGSINCYVQIIPDQTGNNGKFLTTDGSGSLSWSSTPISGAVLIDQTTPQIIGDTTNRLTKLWATDLTVSNDINGSITGNAGTVTGLSVTSGKILTVNSDGSISGSNTGDETQSTIKTKLGFASSGVDGYLTGTDWTTFNGKQDALVNADTTHSGILTFTDWNTFNAKQDALVNADTTHSGILTYTDWNTFNGKQDALGFTPVSNAITVNGHALSSNVSVTATDVGLGSVTNESKATMFTSPTFTGTTSGITATMVGLGSVTNESKATMFTSPTFTGTTSGITATMVGLGSVPNLSFSGSNTGDETQSTIKTKLGFASSGVDGYLTGTDWTTFNGKQNALPNADTTHSGILTYTDWNTFNAKQDALVNADTTHSGILTYTDWNTFNGKQASLVSGSNIKTINGATLLGSTDILLQTPLTAGTDYEVPLTFSNGLTRTVNAIANNLITGLSGGQTVIGGTGASENLTLSSTSNATHGSILFGTSGYDEVNNRLGVNIAAPTKRVDIGYGGINFTYQNPAVGSMTATLAGAGAGNVDNGAHQYYVTFVTSEGESTSWWGAVAPTATVVNKTTDGKVTLANIPLGNAFTTSRKIYRTKAGGILLKNAQLVTTIADNTMKTYTDNTADASLGATSYVSGIGEDAGTISVGGSPAIQILNNLPQNGGAYGFGGIFIPASGVSPSFGIGNFTQPATYGFGTTGFTSTQQIIAPNFYVNGGVIQTNSISQTLTFQSYSSPSASTNIFTVGNITNQNFTFQTPNSFNVTESATGQGTVTTAGTTALVGVGTFFTTSFKVGDTITVATETVRTIATITDATHLTVSVAFSTSTAGLAYTLVGGTRFTVNGNGNVSIPGGTLAAGPIVVTSISASSFLSFNTGIIQWDNSTPVRIGGLRTHSLAMSGIELGRYNGTTISSFTGANVAQAGVTLYSSLSQTGTSSFTDLLVNRAETTIGSGAQNLLDLQVASASKFKVDRIGNVTTALGYLANGTFSGAYSDGIVMDYASGNGRISVGASDGIGFYNGGVAGTMLMGIDSTGKVGIGTTAPGQKLEVAGNISMTGSGYLMQPDAWGMKWNFAGTSDTVEMNQAETAWKFNVAAGGVTKYRFNTTKAGSINGPILDLGLDGNAIFYGNVGIGTTGTPAQALQVVGDIRIGTSGTNGCVENFAGTALAGTCSSDMNLKTNITPIAGDILAGFDKLNPVTYQWNQTAVDLYKKSGDTTNIGLIAQDVELAFPELVSVNKDGYKQVNFTALQFYAIKAIKDIGELGDTFKTRLSTWLADASNGIKLITADVFKSKEVDTSKLCVKKSDGTDICVTGDELDSILNKNGVVSAVEPTIPVVNQPVAPTTVVTPVNEQEPNASNPTPPSEQPPVVEPVSQPQPDPVITPAPEPTPEVVSPAPTTESAPVVAPNNSEEVAPVVTP